MSSELEFDRCKFLLHVRVRQHIFTRSRLISIGRIGQTTLSLIPPPPFNINLGFLLLQESLNVTEFYSLQFSLLTCEDINIICCQF